MAHITAVFGRRWFRKSAGNSYCRAIVTLSSGDTLWSPMESGYGDHYIQVGLEHAARHGFALPVPATQVKIGGRVKYYPDTIATIRGELTHVASHPITGDVTSVQFTSESGETYTVGANYCQFCHHFGGAIGSDTPYLRSRGVAYAHADVAREKDL